jgi:pyruvate dehydrogenase E2 component (dihydrolipoamide acetyltransferase)
MSAPQKLGMPKWGLSMTEGKVLSWLVEEGADVKPGDEVAEVETEKISGAVEAPVAGVLRRLVASPGDVIPVGGLLGVIAGAEVSDADIDAFVAEFQASFVPEDEEDAGPQPETVQLESGALRFLKQGEGEPLVLLHGFGGDLNNWLFSIPALAERHTVYALDLPGHGGSAKAVADPSVEGLAAAVEQFLDSQGLERAHLAGHSLGAAVAASVGAERIASLTLIAPAGMGSPVNGEYVEGFVGATGRRDLKPVLQLLFADETLVTRQLVDDVLKYKRIDGVQEALEAIAAAALAEADVRERVAALDAPVLVLWGAEDRIIPVADDADARVIERAGHSPHMEAAGDVNRAMEEFLKSLAHR